MTPFPDMYRIAYSEGKRRMKARQERSVSMAQCEVCGNEYDKTFEVVAAGKSHVFDSFECAITSLAPTCRHCGCRMIGHGVEVQGAMYCSAHCARQEGAQGMRDRS